jgi:hypothetical protein
VAFPLQKACIIPGISRKKKALLRSMPLNLHSKPLLT